MNKLWKIWASLAAVVAVMTAGVVVAQEDNPTPPPCLPVYDFDDVAIGYAVPEGVSPSECVPTTSTTTTTSTSISPTTTTTTIPSTTTTQPTTTTSTTSTTTTTTEPPGTSFVETFNGNGGLDRFDVGVWHRNIGSQELGSAPVVHGDNNAAHGGSWSADHDLNCGSPATQRSLESVKIQDTDGSNGWQPIIDFNLDQVVYTCVDHVMSSMGDVDGYSVLAFSPKQVFDDVNEVSFDVNLTDLGTRQWWKVGVLSVADCPALDERCMYSDVGASNLPGDLKTAGRLIATWSGGASAGHPGNLMIGNQSDPNGGSGTFNAGTDKMTRYPVTFSDDGSGTVTFRVAETAVRTIVGSFPECPCRVVFYDHNYTPTKSETGFPIGFTWHWDNIVVE